MVGEKGGLGEVGRGRLREVEGGCGRGGGGRGARLALHTWLASEGGTYLRWLKCDEGALGVGA